MPGMLPRERVNRYLFHRQALHPAARLNGIERVARCCAGIRAVAFSTPYLSLLARCTCFAPADLDRAVHGERTLIRFPGPRGSYRLYDRQLAALAVAAAAPDVEEHLSAWELPRSEWRVGGRAVLQCLAGHGRTFDELRVALPGLAARTLQHRSEGGRSALEVILAGLLLGGQVVGLKEAEWDRHRPSAYPAEREQPRPERFYRWHDLYPGLTGAGLTPAAARRELALAYIGAYGPVSRADLAYWTGWSRRTVAAVLAECAAGLVEVRVAGLPGGCLLSEADYLHLRSKQWEELPPAACLLPAGDSLVKGYASSQRLVYWPWQEPYARLRPAVMVDGWVVGFWNYEEGEHGLNVSVALFREPEPPVADAVTQAAARLGDFVRGAGHKDVQVSLRLFDRPGA